MSRSMIVVAAAGLGFGLGCAFGPKCGEGTTNVDGECVADAAMESDTDTDADTDADSDADSDTDADTDTDSDTDPGGSDSDGDGLSDEEEMSIGTDPYDADSDGDTYSDYDELTEGHDPLDANDRIYSGLWPYNPDKSAILDPGWFGGITLGGTVPRFAWVDQYGDAVDIYDFAGHGHPVVVQMGAAWEPHTPELMNWLRGEPSYFDDYYDSTIPDMVAAGDVYWVVVLEEDIRGSSVSAEEVEAWNDQYGVEWVPVLADGDGEMFTWLDAVAYPSIFLADDGMTVTRWDPQDYTVVFDALLAE